jgi:hypothetical protein
VDDYAFATIAAKRSAADTSSNKVFLIGTAAMREGLELPYDIAGKLDQFGAGKVDVVNFMTGGQSAIEAAALVGEVMREKPAVFVLGVSPSRMAAAADELKTTVQHRRLGFQNSAMTHEIKALGLPAKPLSGWYLLDNYEFFAVRMQPFIKNVLSGVAQQNNLHTYDGRVPINEQHWQEEMQRLQNRLSNYQERFSQNIASYGRTIMQVKALSPKSEFILLDIPINPRAIQEAFPGALYQQHVQNMQQFCARLQCTYVNPNLGSGMKREYFTDWSHISTQAGRVTYTNHVLPVLRDTILSIKRGEK